MLLQTIDRITEIVYTYGMFPLGTSGFSHDDNVHVPHPAGMAGQDKNRWRGASMNILRQLRVLPD